MRARVQKRRINSLAGCLTARHCTATVRAFLFCCIRQLDDVIIMLARLEKYLHILTHAI
jgi:hypothetical protein